MAMPLIMGLESLSVAKTPTSGRIVALDEESANLMQSYSPETVIDILIQSETDSYHEISARAWSMRDARYVVYRSDQCSISSQIFQERLVAQGVQAIDLASYVVRKNRISKRPELAVGKSQVAKKARFETLAINRFRKFQSSFLGLE